MAFTPSTELLLKAQDEYYQLEDYQSNVPRWCTGCGDSAILAAMQRLCRDEQLRPENTVSHALDQGIQIGFIASADHSAGHPGDDFWWGLSNYPGGLAAVYAPALTREGVWDALWNRRCYGTTRARILLAFEIDGHEMGEAYAERIDEGEERRIDVNVHGTAAIERVEVVKNGRVLVSRAGNRALDVALCYVDRESERETDYYYVHVVQEDGEQAWSSPIWVRIESR